jgi:AraC-like DNA-binding protein
MDETHLTAPSARPTPSFYVSTDQVPVRDRVAFFREELARIVRVDITPISDGVPRHSLSFTPAGPVGIGHAVGSPSRYVRDRRHLADSDDQFNFSMVERGWQLMEHDGSERRLSAGMALFMSNRCRIDSTIPDGAEVIALRVDRHALGALVRRPDDATALAIDASNPGLALLRGYLNAWRTAGGTLTPAMLHTFGLHVLDLVAGILGATRDGAVAAEEGGVRAARLRAVLAAIAAHACDPGFGIDALGARLGVTPRYIQRLLEETGETFSGHLLEHRLQRAWRLLADPARRDKVAAIAFDCGFGDLSHFNRAFRRRFGETPTAVRGASAAPPPHRPESDTVAERLAAVPEPCRRH